jgi:hypothetical protein
VFISEWLSFLGKSGKYPFPIDILSKSKVFHTYDLENEISQHDVKLKKAVFIESHFLWLGPASELEGSGFTQEVVLKRDWCWMSCSDVTILIFLIVFSLYLYF